MLSTRQTRATAWSSSTRVSAQFLISTSTLQRSRRRNIYKNTVVQQWTTVFFYGNILNFIQKKLYLKSRLLQRREAAYLRGNVGYSLKNQGSNNRCALACFSFAVGYPLKNQGCYNGFMFGFVSHWLDIHLKIKVVTTISV